MYPKKTILKIKLFLHDIKINLHKNPFIYGWESAYQL